MNSERTIHEIKMLILWMSLKKACCKDSNNNGDWIDIIQRTINKLNLIIEDIRKEEADE